MAYQYSLMDDEDDLTAPLLQDPTLRAASLASKPTGTKAREPWTPTASARDPQRDAEWSLAEGNALERSQANDPSKYGVGEFARDNGGLMLASVFDLIGNKGRGLFGPKGKSALPTLMEATSGINARAEAARRQDAKDAGEFALKYRGQKSTDLQDQVNVKRLQQADEHEGRLVDNQERLLSKDAESKAASDERIALAKAAEDRRKADQDRNLNPENPATRATKDALIKLGMPAELVEPLDDHALGRLSHQTALGTDLAATPQRAASDAVIADAKGAASQTGQNRANIRDNPSLRVSTAEGDAAGEDIKRPGKVKTVADEAQAREAVEAPRRDQERSEAFQEKFAKDNDALLNARSLIGKVEASAAGQKEGMPPGLTPGATLASRVPFASRLNSNEENDTIRDVGAAIEQTIYKDSGASASAREHAAHVQEVIGDPTASADTKWRAIQSFRETLDKEISGKSVRGADAQQVLGRMGIAPPPSQGGGAGARPSGLPSLSANTPPAAAPSGARMRTIHDPTTGETEQESMTDAQVSAFQRQNPGVLIQ